MPTIKDYSLYLVISREYAMGRAILDIAAQAIAGGIDILQMREKDMERGELVDLGKSFASLCREKGVTFIVNDDPLLAKEVDADGVHVGQEDLERCPLNRIRDIIGRDKIIGVSTHSMEQFEKANGTDADYISFGPIFPTKTKNYHIGTGQIRNVLEIAKVPVVFIGGININNLDIILKDGARNVGLIRDIMQANDVEAKTKAFKNKLKSRPFLTYAVRTGCQGGDDMKDVLEIGGQKIANRLFVGTGKYSSYSVMKQVLESANVDVATVALRRVDVDSPSENILEYLPKRCHLMVNTSGARDADEAVRIARLARAGGANNWIKIEVINDNKYLLPDNLETLKATEILVKEGFVVFPYMSPDLSMAKRLAQAGAAAVMPLGSPIGTNRGMKTRELVRIMVEEVPAPIIVDAGLGKPSDACECMEMGCAAVLVNTAIAIAEDPVNMARAFSDAVKAGRLAYLSGLPSQNKYAGASSPLTGFLRKAGESVK